MNEELYQELGGFVQELRQEYPDAVIELRSGTINKNIVVDINCMEKFFVLEAAPNNEGYGVTRMTPYNGFTLDCDAWFQTLLEAKQYLTQQLSYDEQTPTEPNT